MNELKSEILFADDDKLEGEALERVAAHCLSLLKNDNGVLVAQALAPYSVERSVSLSPKPARRKMVWEPPNISKTLVLQMA